MYKDKPYYHKCAYCSIFECESEIELYNHYAECFHVRCVDCYYKKMLWQDNTHNYIKNPTVPIYSINKFARYDLY